MLFVPQFTDTPLVQPVSIDYEPFIGITEIEIIVNDFGIGELADTVHFTLTIEENLSNGKEIFPRRFELINAYPNPFNPSITLQPPD